MVRTPHSLFVKVFPKIWQRSSRREASCLSAFQVGKDVPREGRLLSLRWKNWCPFIPRTFQTTEVDLKASLWNFGLKIWKMLSKVQITEQGKTMKATCTQVTHLTAAPFSHLSSWTANYWLGEGSQNLSHSAKRTTLSTLTHELVPEPSAISTDNLSKGEGEELGPTTDHSYTPFKFSWIYCDSISS